MYAYRLCVSTYSKSCDNIRLFSLLQTYTHICIVIVLCTLQFKDPLKAAESLIGLLNGDEIISTFQSFGDSSVSIGVSIFSRIYLILFVFIFIYVVLSLFIGIFDHAYDSLSVSSV